MLDLNKKLKIFALKSLQCRKKHIQILLVSFLNLDIPVKY